MDAKDNQARRQEGLLRRLPPDERLAAIVAVFPHAPAEERITLTVLLAELAARSHSEPVVWLGRSRISTDTRLAEEATLALAGLWREVPRPVRQLALASCRGRWGEAIVALGEGAGAAAASLAELSLDAGDPATLAVLPGLLGTAEPRTSAMIGQTLLAHALRLADPADPRLLGIDPTTPAMRPVLDADPPAWAPADVHTLFEAIAASVDGFEGHRRKEVLLAALLLLEGPRRTLAGRDVLAEMIRDENAPAGRTLRSAFRRAKAPIARQRAWLWARERVLAAACTERIARAPTLADHTVVLELAHLALAPARGVHLAIVPIATIPAPGAELPPGVTGARRLHPSGPVPDRATMALLPTALRRQTPRLVRALEADAPTRAMALEPLLTDGDPLARFGALRALCADDARDYCFDADGRIARHAALGASSIGVAESGRLRAGHGARRRAASVLERSPHPWVRDIGRDERERVTPGWGSALQLLAARRLHAQDPTAFADLVRTARDSGSIGALVGWLMVARRIGAVGTIEPLVLSLVRDSLSVGVPGECRAAATAVACLGELGETRGRSVLVECLRSHPDARVRANAAEALGRARAGGVGLIAGVVDEHHRVRASLLRAMLQPWGEPKPAGAAGAADRLGEMLVDPRPPHRLAGVWVVQRSLRSGLEGRIGARWERLAGRVRWLAEEDTDASVRARAAVVTTRLDAAMAGLGPRAAQGVGA
ncbi:MAG: HEAT repeat domain-containing protein [Phycisphaerales bacterium]|nr:HEAT repeat domain-containing protein [Phycisphaerales bacterium]